MYVAQKGRCAVTKAKLQITEIDCHHKIPREYGRNDEYSNLIIVSDKVHILIHSSNERTLKKYLDLVKPDSKQLAKINKLREMAKMPKISANGELLTV